MSMCDEKGCVPSEMRQRTKLAHVANKCRELYIIPHCKAVHHCDGQAMLRPAIFLTTGGVAWSIYCVEKSDGLYTEYEFYESSPFVEPECRFYSPRGWLPPRRLQHPSCIGARPHARALSHGCPDRRRVTSLGGPRAFWSSSGSAIQVLPMLSFTGFRASSTRKRAPGCCGGIGTTTGDGLPSTTAVETFAPPLRRTLPLRALGGKAPALWQL